MRRGRIANLPPEVSDGVLRTVPSRHGEILDCQVETWSRLYRYPGSNGSQLAMITLTRHISSHITVVGSRVLVLCDG
jgi:hypothetical protein